MPLAAKPRNRRTRVARQVRPCGRVISEVIPGDAPIPPLIAQLRNDSKSSGSTAGESISDRASGDFSMPRQTRSMVYNSATRLIVAISASTCFDMWVSHFRSSMPRPSRSHKKNCNALAIAKYVLKFCSKGGRGTMFQARWTIAKRLSKYGPFT